MKSLHSIERKKKLKTKIYFKFRRTFVTFYAFHLSFKFTFTTTYRKVQVEKEKKMRIILDCELDRSIDHIYHFVFIHERIKIEEIK